MEVYINGMEMPKEPDEMIEIAIFGDGNVIQTGESWRSPENGKCYYTTTTPEKFFNAVSVQPHGRLIDADALINALQELFDKRAREAEFSGNRGACVTWNDAIYHIKSAPTIIQAEEGE